MKLQSIKIMNYRSIDELSFDIQELDDGTFTYGLIGVNEAGKSTILKALALKDGLKDETGNNLPLQKDFKDKKKPISIEYSYILSKEEITKEVIEKIQEQLIASDPSIVFNGMKFHIKLTVSFSFDTHTQIEYTISFEKSKNEPEYIGTIQEGLKEFIINNAHKSIFWTAEDRYLISQPINLSQFASSPDTISVPLKNCFSLAGISNIQERINSLAGDSTEVAQLQTELGIKVTEHIKKVWPKHPIQITFLISDGLIYFHVKDLETKTKPKTADQRSDGFRQFISFLLTISAQNKNEELNNAILLLDEPETHLHPKAQENLLKELIKVTDNERNNIVFFATHSNYMIDKDDLSRNFKIVKEGEDTKKEQFDKKNSTYASINYEVFDVTSTDYHNELYGYIEAEDNTKLESIEKNMKWIRIQKNGKESTEDVSLPKYIRHSIHHPENTRNKKITEGDLKKSIKILEDIKQKIT